MTHAHFYLPPALWAGSAPVLSGEEAKHCRQVTRHHEGDVIVLFDGRGRQATARIESFQGSEVSLQIIAETAVPAPRRPLTLIQAVVKGDTMDWIIEKAVELGAQRIIPVITQRSIVRLNPSEAAKKHIKWQRTALEACKQSSQAWLPEVCAPCSLETACKLTTSAEFKLTASLESQAATLHQLKQQREGTLPTAHGAALAIGPEGDFTPDEYATLRAAGWLSWSLGKLILRSETAAICALSILGYELASE